MSKKLESQIQSVPAKMSPYQIRWQEILIATNGLTSHRSLQPLEPAENGEFLKTEVSNSTLHMSKIFRFRNDLKKKVLKLDHHRPCTG